MDKDKIDKLQLEDMCLCNAWMEVRQNPICGAQQRGGTFWKKSHNFFHEGKNLGDLYRFFWAIPLL
jgi:hypothetical protein